MSQNAMDGISLALLDNRFKAVLRSMMNTLLRTGRSIVLNTGRDFSCCILTPADEILAVADSLPIHVMSGPELMSRSMRELHPELERGDAFLHNSPYHGNSHAADHAILIPVIDDEGIHRFTVLVKAHQADCGNSLPTTYMVGAQDVFEEGALIFPCVKVQEGYRDVADIIRMCELRLRVPEQWRGDYLALIGAARIGERLLMELAAELGWERLADFAAGWLSYSERLMRQAIAKLPSGRTAATTRHDPFPGVPEGIEIRAEVEVDAPAGRIAVDLRDNPPCQPCGLNLSEATSRSATLVGVYNSLGASVPPNSGSLGCVDIVLKRDCVVGIPSHPVSCSAATTNVADRLTNAVQRAMAELADGIGLAESGLMAPPSKAVISGSDDGAQPFINELSLATTGGPGGPASDGWLTFLAPNTQGMTFLNSVEIDEQMYPLLIRSQEIVPDTEGAGRHRGAPSARVEYGPADGHRLDVIYQSDGTVNPAGGARGGETGGRARQFLRAAGGEAQETEPVQRVTLGEGETIISVSCGGGGYGHAWERDIDRVVEDVAEGLVSAARARTAYGVVFGSDGAVDREATLRLRAERDDRGG